MLSILKFQTRKVWPGYHHCIWVTLNRIMGNVPKVPRMTTVLFFVFFFNAWHFMIFALGKGTSQYITLCCLYKTFWKRHVTQGLKEKSLGFLHLLTGLHNNAYIKPFPALSRLVWKAPPTVCTAQPFHNINS